MAMISTGTARQEYPLLTRLYHVSVSQHVYSHLTSHCTIKAIEFSINRYGRALIERHFSSFFSCPFFRIEEQIMHIYCSSSSTSFTCPRISLTVVIYHAAIKIKCRKAVCSSASSIAVKLYSSFIRTLPEYTFSETDTFSDIFCFS